MKINELYKAKDKLTYLRNEAEKQGYIFSTNPYKVLPDISELCEFFNINEYELDYIEEEEELFGV